MSRNDPLRNARFRVEIDGEEVAGFSEVSGLSAHTEVVEYREGNEKVSIVRKLPGLNKVPNVTLKRGITDSLALWEWYKAIMEGDIQRKSVRITVLDESRQDRVAFKLREAWAVKYEASDLNAEGNDVIIETLELAHEGFERES